MIMRRCVTYIFFDVATTIEMFVVWHALKTGAVDVKRLESRMWFLDVPDSMIQTERAAFCEAIAATKHLTWLSVWNILFNDEVARKIGGYVEQATTLTTLQFINAVADDTNAGVFLDHLARNRSVKKLSLPEHLVVARQGQALADVVRSHVTLQEIEVYGNLEFSPSALLAAAVQSQSLRSLIVHECRTQAEDIEAMASALAWHEPSPGFEPPPPTSKCYSANAEDIEAVASTRTLTKLPPGFSPLPRTSSHDHDHAKDIKAMASALTRDEPPPRFEPPPPTSTHCSANAEDIEAAATILMLTKAPSGFQPPLPTSPHDRDHAEDIEHVASALAPVEPPSRFEHHLPTNPHDRDDAEDMGAMASALRRIGSPPRYDNSPRTIPHDGDDAEHMGAMGSAPSRIGSPPVFEDPPRTSPHGHDQAEDKTIYSAITRRDPHPGFAPLPPTSLHCRDHAKDIETMYSTPTRTKALPEFKPPPPTSPRGGTLVRLQLFNCDLGETFAMSAAAKLRRDKRLRELGMEGNPFTVDALRHLIGALEVNKTLQWIEVSITGDHSQEGDSSLFDLIRNTNALSRLYINWVGPRASDFSNSILAAVTPSVCMDLVHHEAAEVAKCLAVIARNRDLHTVSLICATPPEQAVVQALADTFATAMSIKNLVMSVSLCDDDVVKLFGALESNRTISSFNIRSITFWRRTSRALGRLVENNRVLVLLALTVQEDDPEVDSTLQVRYLCRELKEAVVRNRFLMGVTCEPGVF
ncbi:hypothetical protein MTO96_044065 [Rhipicephalus appendiculatus]